MIPFDTSSILKILATGSGIFVFIQGLKNFFPAIFEKVPKLAQILAAVLALVTALMACLQGGIDIACVVTAALTFLTAIGVYHSVAQAGGAVIPPLPPAAETQPK